tara:strand:- start:21435 stop:22232 length:798 start_codon:yes stop_codon:yes gene_type:complete
MINHKHKFIFIEIHKTGTTSICSFFENSIKDGFICDFPNGSKEKFHDYFGSVFEKVGVDRKADWSFCKKQSVIAEYLKGFKIDVELIKHKPLDFFKSIFPEKYDEYFKFTFVRNPWSRAVSLYFRGENNFLLQHKTPTWEKQSFKDFVKDMQGAWHNCDGAFHSLGQKGLYKNQIDFARLLGSEKIETDFIGKTENLENDARFICKKINLDFDEKIWSMQGQRNISPKRKKEKKHYSEYYDKETKNIIAEKFAEDIEYFGYEFEG